MVLPLPEPTDRSAAQCAFATVTRGLDAEGGPTELALPTFPARHAVQAGSLIVGFDAVTEYELVDIDVRSGRRAAHALALTLLRATGMLSQGPMTTRPDPAGPELPLRGSQVPGPLTRRFTVGIDTGNGTLDPFALADAFVPFPQVRAPGGGHRPATGSFLTVDGAEVSTVLREAGELIVRVFNPHRETTVLSIPGRHGRVIDLTGADQGEFHEQVSLRPAQILTVALSGS
jgi:hypothetical protein